MESTKFKYSIWISKVLADSYQKINSDNSEFIFKFSGNATAEVYTKLTKEGYTHIALNTKGRRPFLTTIEQEFNKADLLYSIYQTVPALQIRKLNFKYEAVLDIFGTKISILNGYSSTGLPVKYGFIWTLQNESLAFFGRSGKTAPGITGEFRSFLEHMRESRGGGIPDFLINSVK